MHALRPFVIFALAFALLGAIGFLSFRPGAPALPEPAALVLLGTGLFACAQARRQLLKKV